MTNEELLSVAEIVERLSARFHKQLADHEAKMAEHRAAFGARTEADAKIIAGLREERDRWKSAFSDQSALLGVINTALGLGTGDDVCGEINRLQKERDALRAEIERLTQTPKHPVKVGEWVRMTSLQGSPSTMKQVSHLWIDKELYGFADGEYCRFSHCKPCDPPTADHDAPAGKAAAASVIRDDRNTEPKPGDTVRMIRIPTPGPDFDGLIDFPWNTDWGAVGDVAAVVATLAPTDPPVAAVRVSSGIVVWWPLSCVEVVRTEPDEEVDTTPADEE